ncbi:MAG: hypothetical protein EA378_08110 [Phycisphaerales bacterium]|nr:MAG: hypothetical protein EA378_08110 [Phycisphaerales bacterium]
MNGAKNSTSQMTTADLIELAALDVLALLDPDEREAFERALASAGPAVQAQIRREQTRIAQLDTLLPEVDAPADLRARVIEAVRTASVDALEEELLSVRRLRHAAGRTGAAMLPTRRVSPVWRASSIGFATAAVVFGAFIIWLQNSHSELERQMQSNAVIEAMVARAGSDAAAVLVGADSIKRALVLAGDAPAPFDRASAAVWINQTTGDVVVYHQNLARTPGVTLELVALDANGAPVGPRHALEGSATGGLAREALRTQAGFDPNPRTQYAIVATTYERGQAVSIIILASVA